MTIRKRLTLWYAGVLLASIFLMAGVMYFEFVIERGWMRKGIEPQEPVEQEIAEIVLFYGVPTALLTVLGGWWLLKRALAPLDQLALAAEKLHIDNLNEPLPQTGNGDEVDRLSEVLNSANVRLKDSFKRIQEFTLNASHELKTPLAILQGEIEMALHDPASTAAQRDLYSSQLDEIQRLARIVEGLSLLAKADAGQIPLALDTVRLNELVEESFADAKILAQQREVEVKLLACDEVLVRGDRDRLRQLLLNLTDNAIKYNKQQGRVDISLVRNGTEAELVVSNTGPGIPADQLDRVFDRFFRGDTSHNSEIQGSGLGLSIGQWIVNAHGGKIEINSLPGAMTSVKVRLRREDSSARNAQLKPVLQGHLRFTSSHAVDS
jgi:signal transduction histidine kinase